MTRKLKIVYLILIAAAALAILTLVVLWTQVGLSESGEPAPAALSLPDEPDERIIKVEKTGVAKEQKTFDTTIIEGGLRDMGILITEEYYFTEVASFSSVKTLLGFRIGFTESGYLESYDGSVNAGIDFASIRITADEAAKVLTVSVPKAEIQSVVIDPDSFVLYSEKEGLGNHISPDDFNGSLVELKKNAENKAMEKGVLERADENAETLIANFIAGMPGASDFTIRFERFDANT